MNENERPVAIRLSGVTKCYRLGEIGTGTLQGDLQSLWARLRGREDPNAPLNQRTGGTEVLRALDGVDLTVYRGETVGIIGSNGAGKSTLLKLLSRITAPTSGDIDLYGRVSSVLELGAGFNAQLTGRENVYMNGTILGMSRAEIDARFDAIAAYSEIGQFLDTPVKRYSSGMFVKLAFAVAAHLTSEILIMDEVLAVADVAFQRKCLARLRAAAREEGRTVLYVSHNMASIRSLCDRCVLLEHGKVLFDGDTDTAVQMYLERALGENPVDMDLLQKPRPGRGAESGVRMEHLSLAGKQAAMYESGEPLRLRLTVRAERPVPDVALRLTLRTDTDTAIGTAWSEPVALAAGEQEILFTFPTDSIMTGAFYVSIGLYAPGELRRPRTLDHISRAFSFEVQPAGQTIPWNATAYGPLRLPQITVEKQ